MAAILWSDVTDAFPDDSALAAVPPDLQNEFLKLVNEELSAAFFGGVDSARFRLARIYFAAHLASGGGAAGGGVAAGPIIEEEEGGVRVRYAVDNATSGSANQSTSYGRTFDQFVRMSSKRGVSS